MTPMFIENENIELWKAIKKRDYSKLKSSSKDKSYDLIIRPIILSVIFNKKNAWLISDKEEIILDVLNQAYTAYPYGYIKVALEETGINSYIGDNDLSLINDKVSISLKI